MLIKVNSTGIPNPQLMAMARWVRIELGLKANQVRNLEFKNARTTGTGSAYRWSRTIVVRTAKSNVKDLFHRYPITWGWAHGAKNLGSITLQDRWEALVHLTAHEMAHILMWDEVNTRKESRVERLAREVLYTFSMDKPSLIKEWVNVQVPVPSEKPSVVERRASHAREKLAEWEKKYQTSKRQRKKWADKVKYYNNQAVAAAKKGQ